MIVAYLGSSLQGYYENLYENIQKVRLVCPKCEERVNIHGYYNRSLRFGDDKVNLKILRVKCVRCKSTHAVLPDFISPRKHFSAAEREMVVEDWEGGTPIEKIESPASASTVKRWIAEFRKKSSSILGTLGSVLFNIYGTIKPLTTIFLGSRLKEIESILERLPSVQSSGLLIGKTNIWCLSYMPDVFL